MNSCNTNGKCCCPCHKMPGILIALLGLSFLLRNAGVISDEIQSWVWPSLILVAGLSKLGSGCCKCCDSKE